jgi:hypothetical protein
MKPEAVVGAVEFLPICCALHRSGIGARVHGFHVQCGVYLGVFGMLLRRW